MTTCFGTMHEPPMQFSPGWQQPVPHGAPLQVDGMAGTPHEPPLIQLSPGRQHWSPLGHWTHTPSDREPPQDMAILGSRQPSGKPQLSPVGQQRLPSPQEKVLAGQVTGPVGAEQPAGEQV
jgi:hypothetical protein